MICSAAELDLWDDHDGILLLDEKLLPGTDFSTIYSSHDLYGKLVLHQIEETVCHIWVLQENFQDISIKN